MFFLILKIILNVKSRFSALIMYTFSEFPSVDALLGPNYQTFLRCKEGGVCSREKEKIDILAMGV